MRDARNAGLNSHVNPPTPDIAALADGLTEAKKRTVICMDGEFRTAQEIGTTTACLNRLMDVCRVNIEPPVYLVDRDYIDWPKLAWTYRLNPLGEQVRAHLEARAREANHAE